MDALELHRLQFAFTITYHYLFPQLTMGLALLIVVFRGLAVLRGHPHAASAADFWGRIFGLNFVMGVVTGIPLEFQFGTNWSRFSEASGSVIAQTLAMEGVFAFFLESAFLYLMLFEEKRLGKRLHLGVTVLVCLGTWLSGWFIVVTNAFMQHPVGYERLPDGGIRLASLADYLLNPWAIAQYPHVMLGSVITASFVVSSIGAFYLLAKRNQPHAELFLRVGITAGLIASVGAAFPTGDAQAKMVARHQPVTFAAMEGHFDTESGAGIVLVGQPNMETLTLDNPIVVPNFLSVMTHQRWSSEIKGLRDFDRASWPDNVPLLYYAYHLMVGLGTIFIALMAACALLLRGGRLFRFRPALWVLTLSLPFPYIANTAGWYTAELGRQPWLIYGILRTSEGHSEHVSSGNVLFSLLGFMGLYALLSLLFFFLFVRIVGEGPAPTKGASP